MPQQLLTYLEDYSLDILREAVADVRAHAGPSLQSVSEDDLQVAMYTVLLKLIDTMRTRVGIVQQTTAFNVKEFYLELMKQAMEYIDGQSSFTVGHTALVVRHVVQIASRLGLSDAEVEDLEYAAWIHNIGLINQTQNFGVLPRSLSTSEMKTARDHAVVGAEMVRPISFLAHLVPTILYHHHHYDGSSGGPQGEQIPLGARIICIADAYQAMLEPRAYRPALSRKEALLELIRGTGKQFDPKLVPLAHELV